MISCGPFQPQPPRDSVITERWRNIFLWNKNSSLCSLIFLSQIQFKLRFKLCGVLLIFYNSTTLKGFWHKLGWYPRQGIWSWIFLNSIPTSLQCHLCPSCWDGKEGRNLVLWPWWCRGCLKTSLDFSQHLGHSLWSNDTECSLGFQHCFFLIGRHKSELLL